MNNERVKTMINAYKSSPKQLVVAIDVGSSNMGLIALNRYHVNGEVIKDKSNILNCLSGKQYSKYEEGLIHEYVHNWIGERWESIFSKALIVGVEKQLTKNFYMVNDRRCLLIELAMTCYFRAMIPFGGPLFRVRGPAGWKKSAGIEVGNHEPIFPIFSDSGASAASYSASKKPKKDINPFYSVNKQRAKDKFDYCLRLTSNDEMSKIVKHAVRQHPVIRTDTDLKEALLFCITILQEIDAYIFEALKSDNYDVIMGHGKIRRSSVSRMTPFKKFEEYKYGNNTVEKIEEYLKEDEEEEQEMREEDTSLNADTRSNEASFQVKKSRIKTSFKIKKDMPKEEKKISEWISIDGEDSV